MDCDYSSIVKLDEEFKNGLIIINSFVSGLRTQNYVRLCRLWIDKLINCAPHERKLRNIYLEQLCRHSQLQVLNAPFNCPPNEGPLQVIPQQYLVKQGVVLTGYQSFDESSWSDVSESSCLSSLKWKTKNCLEVKDKEEGYYENLKKKKIPSSVDSTTGDETACTEISCVKNNNKIRYRHHKKFGVHNKKDKKKCLHNKSKRNNFVDSNDESSFKDCYENVVHTNNRSCKRKYIKRDKIVTKDEKINKPSKPCNSRKEHKIPEVEINDQEPEEEEMESNNIDEEEVEEGQIVNRQQNLKTEQKVSESCKNKIKPSESSLHEKIIELEKTVTDMKNENQNLLEKFVQERDEKEELNRQLESLKSEVVSLKDKLILVEKMKNSLKEEHNEIASDVMNNLYTLSSRVDCALDKNDKIESLVIKLSKETENTIQIFKKNLAEKCEELKQHYEIEVAELKESYSKKIENYEHSIQKLKKEVVHRHKEKLKLEKKLQEKCSEMRAEVENIKLEVKKASEENELEFNTKVNLYKSKIVKLLKEYQKVTEFYEQKITALNKTKDMELWVQKLNMGSSLTNGKKQEFLDTINALEEKFRKQLNDATQRTFDHDNELRLKYGELSSELGSDGCSKSEQGSENSCKSDENKNCE